MLNNLDQLSFLFNFIGTIVIVVSLLYLAKQTNLTNRIARGESERELFDTFNELVLRYSDKESIDLIQRAFDHYGQLSHIEKARFNMIYLIPHANNFEQFYQLHKLGLVSDERLQATLNLVLAMIKTPGGSECWQELQHAYNPELVDFLNKQSASSEVPPISEVFHWLKIENKA